MSIDLPFGKIHLSREANWNVFGKDEIAISWELPDLENAMVVVPELALPILSGLAPKGNSKGTVIFYRNRKLSNDFRARGDGKIHLTRLHFNDYPNLEIQGQASVDFKETTIKLSLPKISVRDRSRPDSQPAITLNDFEATISQREFWQRQIAIERALVKSLDIRIFIDPDDYSTFDILLDPEGRQSEEKRAGVQEMIEISPKNAEAVRADNAASPRTPKDEGFSPVQPAEFLPDIKIKRLEVKQMSFQFKHLVEKNLSPFVMERKNINLLIENLDTRMKPHLMETRLNLIGPGQPPGIQLRANLNPGVRPLAAEGVISVHQLELRPFSTYAFPYAGT